MEEVRLLPRGHHRDAEGTEKIAKKARLMAHGLINRRASSLWSLPLCGAFYGSAKARMLEPAATAMYCRPSTR